MARSRATRQGGFLGWTGQRRSGRIATSRCLAHTRRTNEGQHMAARKSWKRRPTKPGTPMQKRSKALSSLNRKRNRNSLAYPDQDKLGARVRSGAEAAGDGPKVAPAFRQPGPVVGSMAPSLASPAAGSWKGNGQKGAGRVRLPVAIVLPGLAFYRMGRPVLGLICYTLQASLAGWLPAALWATYATRQVEQRQRSLAARLR